MKRLKFFIILFWIVINKLQLHKITKPEIILVIINLYGLYRSNNFAATVSLVIIKMTLFFKFGCLLF